MSDTNTILPPLPAHWDERTITHALERYRHQPTVLSHYVEGLRGRFLDGQEIKTLQRRTEFLTAKIAALQVGKEYVLIIRELERQRTIEDTKDVTAQTALEEARREQQGRAHLHTLEVKLRASELELQIAENERKKQDLLTPPVPPVAAPPKDAKAEKRAYWEEELTRLRQDKERMLADTPDEEQRVRVENMYEDKIHEALEQMRKYL